MAAKNYPDNYTLDATGGTISLQAGTTSDTFSQGNATVYYIDGSATLAGSWVVTSTGTLQEGVEYRVVYNADMVLNGNTITIFGVSLTEAQAQSKCEIHAYYDGSAFVTNIAQSEDTKIVYNDGVTTTSLTSGGGTITLTPRSDKSYLYLTGTATLAGSWVVTGAGTAVNHSFVVNYKANLTQGANSVTIFGYTLTAAEALAGGVTVEAVYDTTNSTYRTTKISASASASIYQGKVVYGDSAYGNNSSGAPLRLDLPYLTIAAARTAAVALTPSATNRILVKLRGYFNEQIVLANYVDWDLTGCTIDLQAGAALSTIDDNGVAVNSVIYGNPKIIRSGTSSSAVACIKMSGNGSAITAYLGDLTSSTTGASDAAVLCTQNGVLNLYCNNITAYNYCISGNTGDLNIYHNNLVSTNNSVIYNDGVHIFARGQNLTSSVKSCIASISGIFTGYYNDLTSSGTGASKDTIAITEGIVSVFCKNITQNNNDSAVISSLSTVTNNIVVGGEILGSSFNGAVYADGLTGELDLRADKITAAGNCIYVGASTTGIVRINGNVIYRTSGSGSACRIEPGAAGLVTIDTKQCGPVDGDAIDCSGANNTSIIRLNGRFVAAGTNQDCITTGAGASAPELVIEGASTLIATGTGNSIYSADAATTVKVYVGSVSNKAVNANITQQVSTITVSASVI